MTIRVPIPERKRRNWLGPLLLILLFAVLLIVLSTVEPPVAMAPAVTSMDPASLVENPELSLARRFAASAEAERRFLAANPELIIVRNANAFQIRGDDAAFLATNPEIKYARRYAEQHAIP